MKQSALFDDPLMRALLEGDTYTASAAEDAGGSESHRIVVQNPASSGVILVFYFGEATHEGEVEVKLYDSITALDGGSTPNVANNLVGSGINPKATVLHDPSTFTGGNVHTEQVYTVSGTEQLFNGYRLAVQQGEDMAIEITDQSGNPDEMGIRAAWTEVEP